MAPDAPGALDGLDARIASIRTIVVPSLANLLWVQVESDAGHVGLGETLYYPDAVSGYIHETAAPYLLGARVGDIGRHWSVLYRQWCRSGIGAEARGASALDVALWDLAGHVTGLPIWQLLGGRQRQDLPVYNTCAGPDYVRTAAIAGERWLPSGGDAEMDDLVAQKEDPVGLARSLLAEGVTAMKIWPFDAAGHVSGGVTISRAEIEAAVAPVRAIREALGHEMAIAIELHNIWTLPAAKAIAHALEPYEPMWIEDPMAWDDVDAVAELARSTSIPILGSETLGSRFPYRTALDAGAIGMVATDASWVGGVSEARRVADLASLYARPVTHHDCSGPVNLAVGVHLSSWAETGFIQEIVRSHLHGWYGEVADGLPEVSRGRIAASTAPGHGISLKPEVLEAEGTLVRTSRR